MRKLIEFEIEGQRFPLKYSLRAVQRFAEISFGEIANMSAMDSWIIAIKQIAILMEEGAKYKKIFVGEEITVPTEDDLCTIFSTRDVGYLSKKIFEAVEAEKHREIEVEEDKKQKNVSAAPAIAFNG